MHDARIDLLQYVKTEPEPLQNSRAEIVYNDVGRSHQLLEQLLTFGMAQVKGTTELGPVHVGMNSCLAVFTRNHGGFDLDDFHTVIRQDRSSKRPGILLCQICHAKTFEHGLANTIISHDGSVGARSNPF